MAPDSGRRVYHYDQKIPGLAVCVMPTGTKTFYVVRRIGGKMEFYRLGGWPDLTVENARNLASRINGKVADGINPADNRRADRRVQTLGDAFTDFIALPARTKEKRPRSAKTLHDYRQQFSAYLEPWRHRRIVQICRADVEALHNDLGAKNGFFTANRVLGLLKAIYNAAIDAGYTGPNPAAGVRRFEEHSRKRFLQADELPKFWAALEAEPSEKIRDFVKLALWTGQRRGNVVAMKWSDVNLERAVWNIPQTKTGQHEVPLPSPALEILRRRLLSRETSGPADPNNTAKRLPSEYVFPGLHGHGHLQDPMRQWRGILERAGIEDLRIHDLRRSLGSWQSKTGASLTIVGATLGHTQAQTTMIYGRLDNDPVRAAMETATSAIMAAAMPAKPKAKRKAKGGGIA